MPPKLTRLPLQNNYLNYFSFTYQAANILFLIFAMRYQHRFNVHLRILAALVAEILVFVVTAVLVKVKCRLVPWECDIPFRPPICAHQMLSSPLVPPSLAPGAHVRQLLLCHHHGPQLRCRRQVPGPCMSTPRSFIHPATPFRNVSAGLRRSRLPPL
jgi:hypothetical protein